EQGQFALIVYTDEPFVASPLTDDGKTIDALLPSLNPDVMPIEGQNLSKALNMAGNLIKDAGFKEGNILVLTGNTPSKQDERTAKKLANMHIYTSVIPFIQNKTLIPLFNELAEAGKGQLLPFSDREDDLNAWLNSIKKQQELNLNTQNNVPLWRDEGRKFLFPALIFLLPVFRRGWMQRISL
ncbi:MAG: VWA domain-containing protein, partial [Proteobacteria bacterium]|nr:VWA domain-containing protein [Pseudomonadota bacterium]